MNQTAKGGLNRRSGCPINLTLEVLGDKWSLIVLRDMMFGNRRHFRELLTNSQEGIASNILSDRLRRLAAEGVITREGDASHKQKAIYSLTEMGIQLVPVFAMVGDWGSRWLPVTEELSIRATILSEGGPELWEAFMEDLRGEHLGKEMPDRKGPSVREQLQVAYERVVAAKSDPEAPVSSAS
ncbi:winged helix-turn-helix transcriptional regulator [Nitratireductor basaltis]|uniref:HxlR family transcriptional regulator n=1 Tax=Nitratireductor basaltis TaxID=472175 RepID=A0A084U913_9HYPH|nr:helix-turn-helix domain-containing protein [Nitratireductor basaltis]KFB09449.1 HxlR family transcriptional regulator [Nitratireductor basaltis]